MDKIKLTSKELILLRDLLIEEENILELILEDEPDNSEYIERLEIVRKFKDKIT